MRKREQNSDPVNKVALNSENLSIVAKQLSHYNQYSMLKQNNIIKNNIIVTFKVAIIHSFILIVHLVSACTVIERILNASMRVERFYLLSYILPHPKNLLEPYYISVIVTLHGNLQK